LRVYTTLNVKNAARRKPVRPGWLHSYDRRHGWRGGQPNLIKAIRKLETYEDDDWRHAIEKGATSPVSSWPWTTIRHNQNRSYRALISSQDIGLTGRKKPSELLNSRHLAQSPFKSFARRPPVFNSSSNRRRKPR